MSGDDSVEELTVSDDGTTLPAVDVLTGRAFLTGKSGSGKSNTCTVVAEELLERGFGLLIVDTDGEYVTLTDRYEMRHVGGDRFADEQVDPTDAEALARTSLVENVPVILDVSGYDEAAVADELIERVVAELFALEKEHRKPYLLIVEELQEFLPQQGGGDDLATLLERVAKRGRKRGLGICGVSQRPSSVDKDFVTQCDWMAWHRLTWQNDVDVVRRVLGPERADAIQTFDPGEAFLMTDWDDDVRRVRFREKRTRDAGATPGLDQYEDRRSGAADGAGDGGVDAGSPTASATDRRDVGTESDASAESNAGTEPDDGAESNVDVDATTDADAVATGAGTGAGPTPDTGGGQRDSTAADEPPADASSAPPPRPTPPSRPPNREGVAGNLLEFGELTLYLVRVLAYRIQQRFTDRERA